MFEPQLIEVSPYKIKFTTLNPRRHQGGEFDRLKQSVREVGMVQLPTVRVIPGGWYECIDGEGRIRTAQEQGHEAIWVVSYGVLSDTDAMTMLQAANTVRYFGYLAECRGLATLHRQGMSGDQIAKKMGIVKPRAIINLIAIGYLPDSLMEQIQNDILRGEGGETRGISWNTILPHILPLRQLLPGKKLPGTASASSTVYQGNQRDWFAIEGLYDYSEVQRAVEKVIQQEITSESELYTYIERRRRELFEERFNEELRVRLDTELEKTKESLEKSYDQKLQGAESQTAKRYEAQVGALQKQYEDLQEQYRKIVRDVAKRPEIIEQRELELKKKLQDAEQERNRFQSLQNQVQQEIEKTKKDAQQSIQAQLSEAIKQQRAAMDQQLAQNKADMEAYYAQRDQERQLKAETSVRQAVAHGTELLSQMQQSFFHLLSPGFVKGIGWLSDAEVAALLAQIMAVQETLSTAKQTIQETMMNHSTVSSDAVELQEGSNIRG